MRTTVVICFEGWQVNIALTGRSTESPPFSDGKKYGGRKPGTPPVSLFLTPIIVRRISSFAIFLLPRSGNSCAPPVATGLINHWSVLSDHEPCKTRFFSMWHTRAPVIPVYHAWRRRDPPPERNITRVTFTIISRFDVKKIVNIKKKTSFKAEKFFKRWFKILFCNDVRKKFISVREF